jgi:hypothetical protein
VDLCLILVTEVTNKIEDVKKSCLFKNLIYMYTYTVVLTVCNGEFKYFTGTVCSSG